MFDSTQVIRERMDETRTDLADKLETLESRVVGTVAGATAAVADTVDKVDETIRAVKQRAQDATAALTDAFDLPRQVDRHPWLFLGGAMALGFLGARLTHRREAIAPAPSATDAAAALTPHQLAPAQRSGVGSYLGGALRTLKFNALASGLEFARDAVVRSAPPELQPRIDELLHGVIQKLSHESGTAVASE